MKVLNDKNNIEELISISMDRIKVLMETNTIVGEKIQLPDGRVIIPISKASVGFVLGGGEYSDKSNRRLSNHFPMAGGSGCGMSVSPVGFIVIMDNDVKYIDVENKTVYQTLVNLANKIITKLDSKHQESNDENE